MVDAAAFVFVSGVTVIPPDSRNALPTSTMGVNRTTAMLNVAISFSRPLESGFSRGGLALRRPRVNGRGSWFRE